MTQLTRVDTNTLNRALLGFDSLFNNFEQRFSDHLHNTYPPYNILKNDENHYALQIAVTGFAPEEITVEIDQNQLIVKGQKESTTDDSVFIHRGLATRNFTRTWTLAEHMEVGEGKIKNGVLTIELNKVIPDALKPRVLKLTAE